MGSFDDYMALVEDWANPFLDGYLPSVMIDIEPIFADQTDQNHSNVELGGASNSNAVAEPQGSNRGSLRERIAAKGNFNTLTLNTEDLSKNPEEKEGPYVTISPGFSPTYLLDSPVFLSNPLALPSPTTGKLPAPPTGNTADSAILIDDDSDSDNGKENPFPDANTSSFSYKPVAESSACPYSYAVNKVNPPSFAQQSCSNANKSDDFLLQFMEPSNINLRNNAELFNQKTFTNTANSHSTAQTYNSFGVQEPPPRNDLEVNDGRQRITVYPNGDGGPPGDGYNWRKYGQKPVKGSIFPRSYFKCTHPDCPVKKKVERSTEGNITDVIYRGDHNHPDPSNLNSLNPLDETQLEQSKARADNAFDWSSMLDKLEENNFSAFGDASGVRYESLGQSANISNDVDGDLVTHGSSSTGCDGEGSVSKRRKTEPYGDVGGSSKPAREMRIVIQTTSEIDILEDGYRWRKYGQKIVKGNPNPRSYYKCTTPSCNVRKHVERAAHDRNSVLTTYEGRHNHEVPESRNLGHYPAQRGIFHMGPYEVNQSGQLNYRQGRSRHGSGPPEYVFGMSQQHDLEMAGLGHEDTTGQQASMAPPRMDPVSVSDSDSGLNDSDATEAYNQLMSQMPPPGP